MVRRARGNLIRAFQLFQAIFYKMHEDYELSDITTVRNALLFFLVSQSITQR